MKTCKRKHDYDDYNKYCPVCRKESDKRWKLANKDKTQKSTAKWQSKNQEHIKKYKKQWRDNNKEHRSLKKRQWYLINRTSEIEKVKEWYKNNKGSKKKIKYSYHKKRRQVDPIYRLKTNIKALIGINFRKQKYTKSSKTTNIIGCSFEELYAHLVNSALRNYGFYLYEEKYHIDHIIPISVATTEEEVIKLNHYSNLQYLYPEDNRIKSNKINWSIK